MKLFGLVFILLVLHFSPCLSANLVVISDLDDTAKWSHMHHGWHLLSFVINGMRTKNAFAGMPALYNYLYNDGAYFDYVSGQFKYGPVSSKRIIRLNQFPEGAIFQRSWGEKTEEFKIATIKKRMDESPADSEFILLGDNGEKDAETYYQLQTDPVYGPRIKAVFIHKLYHGKNVINPKSNQKVFYTSAELALWMREFDLINDDQLFIILNFVRNGLLSHRYRAQILALPYFSQLNEDDIKKTYASLPAPKDLKCRQLSDEIKKLIFQRAKLQKNRSCIFSLLWALRK